MSDWRVERLDGSHARKDFSCGNPDLDKFIKELAGQYERKHLAVTYVLIRREDASRRVWGYYTLSASAIARAVAPANVARETRHEQLPVLLLGRLAVDQSLHGQQLGQFLLMDAFRQSVQLAQRTGIFALEVNASADVAQSFYVHHQFVPLLDNPKYRFIMMKTIERLFPPEVHGGMDS